MGSNHTYLAVINLDSALEKSKNYYPQVFLKECFYIEKKVIGHINDNFSSSDEYYEEQMFFDKYLSWLLFTLFIGNT